MYLERIAGLLGIDYYKHLSIEISMKDLKEVNTNYLQANVSTQSLRD